MHVFVSEPDTLVGQMDFLSIVHAWLKQSKYGLDSLSLEWIFPQPNFWCIPLPTGTHACRTEKEKTFFSTFIFIYFLSIVHADVSHAALSLGWIFPRRHFLNSFTHACCTYIESKKTSFFFQLVIGVSSKNLPHYLYYLAPHLYD